MTLLVWKFFRNLLEYFRTSRKLPGYFKSPEKSDTAKHRKPQWRHHLMKCENHLQQAAHNDKEVETVEQWHKISLKLHRFSLNFTSSYITITATSSRDISSSRSNILPESPMHTSWEASQAWREPRRTCWWFPESVRATLAGCSVRWQAHRCWATRGWWWTRTSPGTWQPADNCV